MITTRVFDETVKAYNDGYRIIGNRGGTRSSKTFSELQVFKKITDYSKKKRIITVVSHSLPHLETGAIRDFDNILEDEGIFIPGVKTQNPYLYRLNKSIVEFVGFDRPNKALGAARDILLINEANKMPFDICQQLIIRTTEAIFMDWNPSEEFWWDTNEFEKRSDCKSIHSTFFDNVNTLTGKSNLTDGQIAELHEAKRKAIKEDRAGKRGYWWNWWQVYGLGLKGQLEGVIFQNWEEYDELPDCDSCKIFAIDFGGLDPTTLIEINFDGKNNDMYVFEHVYTPQILNTKLIEKVREVNPMNKMVVCDSARKDKIFELQMAGINASGATKGEGSIIDGIELMQEFNIFIHRSSENLKTEFKTYAWAKDKATGKSIGEPIDSHNHGIDSIRYATRFYRKNIKAYK